LDDIYFYSRRKKYFEFSNFYIAPIKIDGKIYMTVEHYFQSMKALDEKEREKIRKAPTPKEAKILGRRVKLRPDWEKIKERIMYKALMAKFTQHQDLKELLLSTGNAKLHEDSPYDKYWGVKGKDRLGILLMKVREQLQKENKKTSDY